MSKSYLAFDPGKTTGWALFNEEGVIIEYGQASFDELIGICDDWANGEIIAVICEEFSLYRHKAVQQSGSKMETSQAIGIIKRLAKTTGATIIMQPASILPIALKWTQTKMPSNHAHSHWVSAYNHGMYYLIKNGVAKTALENELDGK